MSQRAQVMDAHVDGRVTHGLESRGDERPLRPRRIRDEDVEVGEGPQHRVGIARRDLGSFQQEDGPFEARAETLEDEGSSEKRDGRGALELEQALGHEEPSVAPEPELEQLEPVGRDVGGEWGALDECVDGLPETWLDNRPGADAALAPPRDRVVILVGKERHVSRG